MRIGVMLDSWSTSAWVARIIEDINQSGFAQISLVILNTPEPSKHYSLRARIKRHWNLTLYHRYERWDYMRNKHAPDAAASTNVSALLAGARCIQVQPIRKGFTDRLTPQDLTEIRAENLDVILRFGFRIIRGDILNAARYGVWSFHHDDNLEFRGGPPLFWEIHERNPVSGTVLQILTDSLDGGHVIYRSHSSTNFTSLWRNRNPIYWKTADFVLRRLRDLDQRGWSFIESLDTYNEPNRYSKRIYRTPNTPQMLSFFRRFLWDVAKAKLSQVLSRKHEQWFLAVRKRLPANSFADPSGYNITLPPSDRFYADPFLLKYNGKQYLFMEVYLYAEHRAIISYAEIDQYGAISEPAEALRRPYHLSYPFLFEHDGQMYMIPETKENRTVELYRAEDFPAKWTLAAVLLNDIYAVDATIHQADGKFWMFVGVSNGRYSNCDELALFYSESLLGPWQPHRNNPILSDVRRARPAGALFVQDGKLIRPSQDCAKAYGYAVCFSEVVTLNELEYREVPLGYMGPQWADRNLGTHTYNRTDDFEAIDGKFLVKQT